jgi:hypothetical protein
MWDGWRKVSNLSHKKLTGRQLIKFKQLNERHDKLYLVTGIGLSTLKKK